MLRATIRLTRLTLWAILLLPVLVTAAVLMALAVACSFVRLDALGAVPGVASLALLMAWDEVYPKR